MDPYLRRVVLRVPTPQGADHEVDSIYRAITAELEQREGKKGATNEYLLDALMFYEKARLGLQPGLQASRPVVPAPVAPKREQVLEAVPAAAADVLPESVQPDALEPQMPVAEASQTMHDLHPEPASPADAAESLGASSRLISQEDLIQQVNDEQKASDQREALEVGVAEPAAEPPIDAVKQAAAADYDLDDPMLMDPDRHKINPAIGVGANAGFEEFSY